MIADISSLAFVSDDLNLFLQKCLEIIGKSIDLSRTYIFRHYHETDTMDNMFEWFAPGVSPQKENLQDISAKDAVWWVETLRNNRIINYRDIEELPYEAEKNILGNQQIKSVLAVPLFVKKEYYGFMGFDECRRQREWPREDIALLKSISEIIAMCIERDQDRRSLRRNQALLRATIDSLPFDLFAIDKGGRYSITNSYARHRWGEIAGKRPQEVAPNKEMLHQWLKNRKAAFSGVTVKGEVRFHFNGKTEDIYNIISPVRIDDEIIAIVGINLDITDQKRIENELKASEKRYRELVENMSEVVFMLDRSGRISYISPAVLDITEYSLSDITGRFAKDFIYQEDLPRFEKGLHEALTEGKGARNEYRFMTVSGDIRWIATSTRPVYSGDEITGIQGTFLDITERKQAEEASRKSERRLKRAQEIAHLGSWELVVENNVLVWSDEVYRIFGFEPRQFRVTYETFLRFIHPGDRQAVHDTYMESIRSNQDTSEMQHRIVRPDGKIRVVHEKCEHIRDSSGKIIRSNGMVHDITDRVQIEEDLRKSRYELELRVRERTDELRSRTEQLTRLSSQMTLVEQRERNRIAGILHDHLQQLMVGAKMSQELLLGSLDGPLKLEAERSLNLINQSIESARSLTAELTPPIFDSNNFTDYLRWLTRWMKKIHNFEVKLRVEGRILLNRRDIILLLFHSVRELLFNVLKHAGVKSATVKTKIEKTGDLRIEVADKGVGCDPGSVLKEAARGDKFGLISIRERLTYLGGRFGIERQSQGGCKVSLIIPLENEELAESKPGLLEKESPIGLAPARDVIEESNDKIRVMLVDDHPVFRDGLSRMLDAQSDMKVVGEASDGEQAVDLVRKIIPDVILMDISMPKMNGLEAARIIHSEFPHIRIIGLSMYEEDDQAVAMMDAGASAYRTKSGNTESLLAAIRGEDQ